MRRILTLLQDLNQDSWESEPIGPEQPEHCSLDRLKKMNLNLSLKSKNEVESFSSKLFAWNYLSILGTWKDKSNELADAFSAAAFDVRETSLDTLRASRRFERSFGKSFVTGSLLNTLY